MFPKYRHWLREIDGTRLGLVVHDHTTALITSSILPLSCMFVTLCELGLTLLTVHKSVQLGEKFN